ncbi:S41 family peptidase [Rufibacter latericius]|uniref:Tricorn protease homolog n=1 Tax=Rufibacter latericius TaxID=2487040 RepID=A0A3M9N2F0_9BACT|nr:S41 family peptidase [Rufibacter latericius]RNI31507.1 peptidase S41 [Rufibacter latericius]
MKKRFLAILALCCAGSLGTMAQTQTPLWLNTPAISPDGQTIVFSYKGDLYKVAATGGNATPLTMHEGYEYMPVWSPDGKSIAYASDRYGNFDVFVMPAQGGESKRLTFHSSSDVPSDFTPDGKNVIFSSARIDAAANTMFPSATFPELYSVSLGGGRNAMVLTTPAEAARYNASGDVLIYQDKKSLENNFRKHQTSSTARDIWTYNTKTKQHAKLTDNVGEDRQPVFTANGQEVYYLSEQPNGTFNVRKMSLQNPKQSAAVTNFSKHPVRHLSGSKDGVLSFTYNGEIYTLKPGAQPQKVAIQLYSDIRSNPETVLPISGGMTEMEVSPNGKEVVFVNRGEVFVSSVDGGITRRITSTPEQERSVSFSPDGRKILYASERNGSWNIYETSLVRSAEPYFYASTVLKEEPVIATAAEEFQPAYSPDGKEVAYLEERVTLKVVNKTSKQVRTILGNANNYSYSDGDQYFEWSPDSKWFLVQYNQPKQWLSEVGLISASGKGEIINLTQSGYYENSPQWMMGGKMITYYSNREGLRGNGNNSGTGDIYALFTTQDGFDRFKLSKEDFTLLEDLEKREAAAGGVSAEKADPKKKSKKGEAAKTAAPAGMKLELDNLPQRKARLTATSSDLADAVVTDKGDRMFYLSRFEKGYDLWVTNLRDNDTKLLAKLGARGGDMVMSKDGKNLFVLTEGKILKVDTETGKQETLKVNGEMNLNAAAERAYMYDHVIRQLDKKFYVKDLHNVDWKFYTENYRQFLPHIANNYDFADVLSELLGELNASHTGGRYSHRSANPDATASLGLFYDEQYTGPGLKVKEVINLSPFDRASSKVKPGIIIEKIDGQPIEDNTDVDQLLNRKSGKYTLVSLYNEKTKQRWEETAKPISGTELSELLYQRWIDNRRKEVDRLSGGRLGYVHIRGMNDASYRTVYEDGLGKNATKEALVVDTRSNGGGNLHDDLISFLNTKQYAEFIPRGQNLSDEPRNKWTRPSIVVMNESNYSDAHIFPVLYKELGIGKTVGMPVAGTGTFVWWETLIDPTMVFGIPQVGYRTLSGGKFLENAQLEPDYLVANDPALVAQGRDQQIEKAVEVLLKELPAKE